MRKELVLNTYTQLNTNQDIYMIQNLSKYNLMIKVSDTEPSNTEPNDFIIKPFDGITNVHIIGILWGKPEGKVDGKIGIVEG